MKYGHNLKFRDSKDQSFADAEVKRFIDNFIDKDTFSKVEITRNEIYLFRHNETGFENFTIYGLRPGTAKEMVIYITALNNSSFTKGLYKGVKNDK